MILRLAASISVVLIASLGLTGRAAASQQISEAAERWQKDLEHLAGELTERHPDPFHAVSRAEFEAAVAELDGRIPELAEHEIIAGMARIVALLEDRHTRLSLPVNHDHLGLRLGHSPDPAPDDRVQRFHALPVRFYLFSDGLYVRSATRAWRHLLGTRVVAVEDLPAQQALDSMRPLLPIENESTFRLLAPKGIAIPELRAAAGLGEEVTSTRLALEDSSGRRFEVALPALEAGAEVGWIDALEEAGSETPLWLSDARSNFWFDYLQDARTVYVQVNVIEDTPTETLASFARRLFTFVDDRPVDRIVLDLRHNQGGDASLARSLVLGLIRWEKIPEPGHVFVLTGRLTFSAAILLCNELEHYTQVAFVGEPVGGRPSHYGDSRKTQLPNSGLTLRVSSVYWRDHTAAVDREALTLDLPAPLSFSDYIAGRDPALEAALAYDRPEGLTARLVDAYERGGINSALLLYYRTATDPATADRPTEVHLNALGDRLIEDGQYGYAAGVFGFSVERHPGSSGAHRGRGEALMKLGSFEPARQALEKALELDPTNAKARRLLDSLDTDQR